MHPQPHKPPSNKLPWAPPLLQARNDYTMSPLDLHRWGGDAAAALAAHVSWQLLGLGKSAGGQGRGGPAEEAAGSAERAFRIGAVLKGVHPRS